MRFNGSPVQLIRAANARPNDIYAARIFATIHMQFRRTIFVLRLVFEASSDHIDFYVIAIVGL
jgi:hypothetical protein